MKVGQLRPRTGAPPLPMNPGSTSPATKGNVSPGIQAMAASFTEKMRENAPSPYISNPMPPKSSPEKSLIKGQFHKRMQSFQNSSDPRSEFLNYLESKSPERPQRASTFDSTTKPLEKSLMKSEVEEPEADHEPPNLLISPRYLSKPILGESTPPSATMLALQNMQLPCEPDSQPKSVESDPFVGPSRPPNYSFESLSTQIHSLTDIASNLQREMAQLSRRSKDNATDLVSLKAATNARDEDIRKSLRELSSNLNSRFLEPDAATRFDFSALLGSDSGVNHRESDSSPNSKKSYGRMPSPNPFAAAMERELAASPTPISDGSASIALLEKVLREMATKEGQEKLTELVDEIKARPVSDVTGEPLDSRTTKMLEEILSIVKDEWESKALVRTRAPSDAGHAAFKTGRSKSMDPEHLYAPDLDMVPGDNGRLSARSMSHSDEQTTDEMLSIMRRVKNSVIEGGGMTNEVKALVRELRGEVLGMGRNLARKLEDIEIAREAAEDKPAGPGKEEISAIVNDSLCELREQLEAILSENKQHSAALLDFRSAMDGAQIYSIVQRAFNDLDLSQLRDEPRGATMEKDDILDAVRDAWETYKPEIELENFGLERDEILECLSEGLKAYQPRHEDAVTYDQVLAAVQAGMQQFEQPPSITKDEIVHTIRECLETSQTATRSVHDDKLDAMREDILQAVTQSVASQSALTRESLDSGLGREEILNAVGHGIQAHFTSSRQLEQPHITKEDVANVVNDAFYAQQSALSTNVQPTVSRDEILAAIAEGLEAQNSVTREIELNKDDLMEAISAGLQEANAENHNIGDQILERVLEHHDGMREELKQQSLAKENDTMQILDAIKDGIAVVRQEVEGYAATAAEASGTHEIMDTVKEGFRLLQADMERTIAESVVASVPRNPDTPELLDAMEKEFEHLRSTISSLLRTEQSTSSDKDEILDAIRDASEAQKIPKNQDIASLIKQEFEQLRESMNMSLVRAEPEAPKSDKDEIIAALRENLDSFRGEKSVTSDKDDIIAALRDHLESFRGERTDKDEIVAAVRENLDAFRGEKSVTNDKDEIIAALRESFETFRGEKSTTSDKDEIIAALRESFDTFRGEKSETNDKDEIIAALREHLESFRGERTDKDEIIAALRENLETFRDEGSRSRDLGDNEFSTGDLIDVFNDGVGNIRDDLGKLLERPVEFDYNELLDTLKEGLSSLKADVEMLRKSQLDAEDVTTTRGGELMLANQPSQPTPHSQPDISSDMEALKSLISQLQTKVEAIESAPRAAEPATDALKKEHLDEVLAGLHELQGSVTGIVARENPADDTTAKKEDTEAIETLLRSTKAQLDEMKFPAADELARAEQLGSLETTVKETKEALFELSTRLEAEGPTKSEIGTLETLMKDMWLALDELKGKNPEGGSDTEQLVKADLQTVEAMIFEVKTQIDELKLPDPETLPTKTEVQDLSALVTEFREKVEAENELTAQGFEARKVEHAGLAEKIEEAKAVVEGLGDELKSKLDGSSEGLSELKQLLEGLAVSAESFTTVENVKELTELINREFERARGEQDAHKLEKEERDAASLVKQDETRAAIIVELGAKIDEKLGEVMAKYDDMQTAMDTKFSESIERDSAHLEAATNTKSLAEDIKLVIGTMGDSVNEACERITEDTKSFLEKVDVSYNKMEEMHNEVKTQQEQARSDIERAAAATDRVESKLHEFHPQVLESIQEILNIVGQHYDHSQKSAEAIKTDLSALPSTIPQMLPALPPPEPEKYDDSKVQEKLDNLLHHAKNEKVQEALNILVERVTNDQVHEKLDQLLSQTTSTNSQMYDKLDELLNHAAENNGPIHDKLDTLIDHATNTDQSVTQMMKLDEMHKDIMETSRKMTEMFAAQSAIVAEDNERKRREAEEAAVALERRNAQKEQVESEIVDLKDEKESLLKMIQTLKAEKEDLVKQTTKLGKELSSLEMALELRHEEMQVMEDRADSLEKRILEGVLDHARSVLLSRPNNGLNMKKSRGSRARGPSAASNSSTAREARNILSSSVGMALRKRSQAPSQAGAATPTKDGKERRILSLSNMTGNRGPTDRQSSVSSGFASLKRSHSVKSNISDRKSSWGGRSSVLNKENEGLPEEDENRSDIESDAGTERKTSYADSMVYGAGSTVSNDRRLSGSSTATEIVGQGARSVANDGDGASETHDDLKGDDPELDSESSKMVLYGQHSDSGIGVASVAG
ncbi:chromosome segregation ATPase family protein [Aspergillus nomiae NRRL 13137]|uniref:Chromosome segregation ATPase family protein n=1 Tax=Aspergillus nomiae NRRL (strain ATCC 15546 / NRRL 13137 / CBS 260.88 / M93) TaxID=1509407 RepID=A0A0L1IZ34_ASPN3|nr:chromosome segregation ATPase family protein [Aspergillus nomiae NRRL 13137]KNG84665.1 chromosome segregation ATPase family protein [Aspergillus nomiae NRRL 13137]